MGLNELLGCNKLMHNVQETMLNTFVGKFLRPTLLYRGVLSKEG